MNRTTVQKLFLGAVALVAACSSTPMNMNSSDPFCGRRRDIEMRCIPSHSACTLQNNYDSCVASESIYRSELSTAYLNCYPTTIGCDSASANTAASCLHTAAGQIAISAALMTVTNNICSRCPNYASDQAPDMMTCVMNTNSLATDKAQSLRYFSDDTLNKLNTCLTNTGAADGCISFNSCYQNVLPASSTKSCGDGGT